MFRKKGKQNFMSLWICADERPSESRFYYFKKSFEAPQKATFQAQVCGDMRYCLFLNETLVCEGPCQGSQYVKYFETVDLTPYLKEGKNELSAKVFYAVEGSCISLYRGSRPAFWFDGVLVSETGEDCRIGTDESWECLRDDGVSFRHMPGLHTSIPPFEEVNGKAALVPVQVKGLYTPNIQKDCYNPYGLGEIYHMVPRPIPQMETRERAFFKPVRTGEGFVELDAGCYTTAKIEFTFSAKAGTKVRLVYSECYTVADEKGNRYKDRRDDFDGNSAQMDGGIAYDVIYATGEKQTFIPFWYRSFRFVRVEFEKRSNFSMSAEGLSYRSYFYPLSSEGRFLSSDVRLNQMWEVSRNTVLCCMHEMYVDCPFYEQQQYDMDSMLEMLFTFRLSSDARMPFKSITDLAHSQMADGMLQANYPSVRVQIIPDFTLFWILTVREYLRYAGSSPEQMRSVRALTGTIDKALECFEGLKTPEGLIGATPYWPFVDWVPAWKAGVPNGGREEPLTVTCLMYAAALQAAAEICDTVGRKGTAADYRERAERMIEAVNRQCYDTEAGLYRDVPSLKEYSEHTAVWAILCGAVTGKDAGALIDRTFDGHVPVAHCTFSMNYFLFRALEAANRYSYAPKVFEGWQKMLDLHCTTWCENPDDPRSECHGWSSAPIYEFSEMLLGVYPTADGYRSVRIRPYIHGFGLSFAKGSVPTPHGEIRISWEKKEDQFFLDVMIPRDSVMDAEIELPNGQVRKMTHWEESFTCHLPSAEENPQD